MLSRRRRSKGGSTASFFLDLDDNYSSEGAEGRDGEDNTKESLSPDNIRYSLSPTSTGGSLSDLSISGDTPKNSSGKRLKKIRKFLMKPVRRMSITRQTRQTSLEERIEPLSAEPESTDGPEDYVIDLPPLLLVPNPNVAGCDLSTAIEYYSRVQDEMSEPSETPLDCSPTAESEENTHDFPVVALEPEIVSDVVKSKYTTKKMEKIHEVIQTEEHYVAALESFVEEYIPRLMESRPETMKKDDEIKVIGNIRQILDFHKNQFLEELRKYAEAPDKLGDIFIRFENKFEAIYVKYLYNKPTSAMIFTEHMEYFQSLQNECGHRMSFDALLYEPIHRIHSYPLFLKDLLKYTEKGGEDTKSFLHALEVMKTVITAANNMMDVGGIVGFPQSFKNRKLLLRDTLSVMEVNQDTKQIEQKFRPRKVFLFDQIIIISEEKTNPKDSFSGSTYHYTRHLMVNRMGFNEKGNGDPNTFTLIDNSQKENSIHIQASSLVVYKTWCVKLKAILDMQKHYIEHLQKPMDFVRMEMQDNF